MNNIINLIKLIKETLREAKILQAMKETSQIKDLQSKLLTSEKEKEKLRLETESAKKLYHYLDRAFSKKSQPGQFFEIKNEVVRCIDKYSKVSYQDLIAKHYECE